MCFDNTPIVSDLRPTLPQLLAMNLPLLSVTGERPNMLQLIDIDFPSRVGEKFNVFGTLLLQDEYGNKMENIMEQYWGRPERITMTVLREWLAGKGVEVSWESLIATLRKSKLQLMAKQIQIALDKLRATVEVITEE